MKPKFKLTLMAVVALLALAYQARASLGTTVSHEKLSISWVITTNGTWHDDGTTTKYRPGKCKITTKSLLDLFAAWDGSDRTVEPWNSAQLVMSYENPESGLFHVLVVDKTGTNILFNAMGDYFGAGTHYFYVDFSHTLGAYSQISSDSTSAFNTKGWNNGYFQLHDDNYFLNFTSLWGYGPSTDTFSEDSSGYWRESIEYQVDGADQYFEGFGGENAGTISGSINGNGHKL
jgi:hypothetical protein